MTERTERINNCLTTLENQLGSRHGPETRNLGNLMVDLTYEIQDRCSASLGNNMDRMSSVVADLQEVVQEIDEKQQSIIDENAVLKNECSLIRKAQDEITTNLESLKVAAKPSPTGGEIQAEDNTALVSNIERVEKKEKQGRAVVQTRRPKKQTQQSGVVGTQKSPPREKFSPAQPG